MKRNTETKLVTVLSEKVRLEIHKLGTSIGPYLPKDVLKAIPCTAQKVKSMNHQPWLVDCTIRLENGNPVIALEFVKEGFGGERET